MIDYNHDYTYHSTGGMGYTNTLPKSKPGEGSKKLSDMWGSAESQEMASVSPAMHYEFAMQYEKRFLELFGLNGYGCCDDLTNKLDYVLSMPNIRRISVSPWANIEKCAERIGDQAILSIKLNPAFIAGRYDEVAIDHILDMVDRVSSGRSIEVIVKDTHTCNNSPEKFTRISEQFYQIFRE